MCVRYMFGEKRIYVREIGIYICEINVRGISDICSRIYVKEIWVYITDIFKGIVVYMCGVNVKNNYVKIIYGICVTYIFTLYIDIEYLEIWIL